MQDNIVHAVCCIACKKLHRMDADTYVRVQGNIYIGHDGGVIGNNIYEDHVDSTYFCIDCFKRFVTKEMIYDDVITNMEEEKS